MLKIKKYINIAVYLGFVALIITTLVLLDVLFCKIQHNSITVGYTVHEETIDETLARNKKALEEADYLIEDARKRGLLE